MRGVVATDALIGTHTSLFDPSLLANRCFLYHLIGRGTGEWLVPVGGMGAVADQLIARTTDLGIEIRCGVEVVGASRARMASAPRGRRSGAERRRWSADRVLAAVAPASVLRWLERRRSPRSVPR